MPCCACGSNTRSTSTSETTCERTGLVGYRCWDCNAVGHTHPNAFGNVNPCPQCGVDNWWGGDAGKLEGVASGSFSPAFAKRIGI